MQIRCSTIVFASLVAVLGAGSVHAQAVAAGTAAAPELTLRAIRVPNGSLTVDGSLDEAVYAANKPTTGFLQQEPHEGERATEQTDVWVLFDDENVYFVARMWDSHPERMIANEMRRDSGEIFQNESLSVSFDTFHDKRTGYYFMTNILGAMRDAQVVSETQLNSDWNPIWNPRSRRFEQGWSTEIAVPFKSIRYPSQGEQVWGVQFRRSVRWKNEISHLTSIPPSAGGNGIMRMSQAATLVGLRTPKAGRNLEIKPYAISRLTTDRVARPAFSNDVDADFGGDVKYGITNGLTADFTYNTDFAQVEDDRQQVNLTRFGLQFPEKREFFLEGQGVFNFGGASGAGAVVGMKDMPLMFFSRQIGLFGGQAVPIDVGARLTGKLGDYSLGLINIQTADQDTVAAPATNFSVVRVKRDVFGKSQIGVIATHRAPQGEGENTLLGADGNIAFGLTNLNAYYAGTQTPGREGRDRSYFGSYDYNADRYGAHVEHLTVGTNFNPETGFLRRQDFRHNGALLRFSPRPKNMRGIRKFSYQTEYDYYTDNENRLQSREAAFSFHTDLDNGDSFGADTSRSYEALDEPFRIDPAVTIPVGGYGFQMTGASYTAGPRRKVRGTFRGAAGTFYGGTRQEAGFSGRVDITRQILVEPNVSLNWIDLPYGSFQTNVVSAKTTYSLTPRSFFAALVQYNSSTHTLSSNLRFRWEYVPGSDLFVVYNDGRSTIVPDRFAALQNRTFIVKLTRMFRY